MSEKIYKEINGRNSFRKNGKVEVVYLSKEIIDICYSADNECRLSSGRPHLYFDFNPEWMIVLPITTKKFGKLKGELVYFLCEEYKGTGYLNVAKSLNVPISSATSYKYLKNPKLVHSLISLKKEIIQAAFKRLNSVAIKNNYQVDNKRTDKAISEYLNSSTLKSNH